MTAVEAPVRVDTNAKRTGVVLTVFGDEESATVVLEPTQAVSVVRAILHELSGLLGVADLALNDLPEISVKEI